MKKFVLKLDINDDKDKRKAMKTVSTLSDGGKILPGKQNLYLVCLRMWDTKRRCKRGIDSISMEMKDKKLTVIGTADPVNVVSKLRKFWPTHVISVGPAKEPEKKEEAKKEEPKKEEPKKEEAKEEPKKEEPKKEEPPKKEEEKKPEPEVVPVPPLVVPYNYRPYYYPPAVTYYQAHRSMEENPNACVIC